MLALVIGHYCFALTGDCFFDRHSRVDSAASIEVLLLPCGHACTANMGCF